MFDTDDMLTTEVDDITISAARELVEENKSSQQFVWGYYFCIENNSDEKISLLGKSWHITDDKGNNYADESAGFKGEIPDLEPGEIFEFSSIAPLNSANAVFYGSCKIKAANDEIKDIRIPTFEMSVKQMAVGMVN